MKITKEIVERAFADNGFENQFNVIANNSLQLIVILDVCENGSILGTTIYQVTSAIQCIMEESYAKHSKLRRYKSLIGELMDNVVFYIRDRILFVEFDKETYKSIECSYKIED